MNFAHQVESSTNFITELQTPVVPPSLVEPVAEPLTQLKSKSDLERLQSGLEAIQELQDLAHEYGIADIFKTMEVVLQVNSSWFTYIFRARRK